MFPSPVKPTKEVKEGVEDVAITGAIIRVKGSTRLSIVLADSALKALEAISSILSGEVPSAGYDFGNDFDTIIISQLV